MCNHKEIKIEHEEFEKVHRMMNRRGFITKTSLGLGAVALNSIINSESSFSQSVHGANNILPSFIKDIAPKAKRVVYLFQSGGPSQLDLFDYKPILNQYHGLELPDSVRKGQRLTGMSSNQTSIPVTQSLFSFNQYGESRSWVSELMPHTAKIVDELCFIKSMNTEAINHDPAITFFQTGSMLPGRPSIGSWVSYGLGSSNENLPTFVVLVTKNKGGQPLYTRLWGNAFLPADHQGVQFRSGKDPVLYLENPENYEHSDRKDMIEYLRRLNSMQYDTYGDPYINARMTQYFGI